jgi:hypothetical protein
MVYNVAVGQIFSPGTSGISCHFRTIYNKYLFNYQRRYITALAIASQKETQFRQSTVRTLVTV